jgi:hypothetical protein
VSAQSKREYVQAIYARYRQVTRRNKGLLDEFCQVTGYHRKHAVRVLNGPAPGAAPPASGAVWAGGHRGVARDLGGRGSLAVCAIEPDAYRTAAAPITPMNAFFHNTPPALRAGRLLGCVGRI